MQQTSGKTILLVEDDPLLALAGSSTVKSFGYDVLVTHSGEGAVYSVATEPSISLILMDMDLGNGINGTEAARRILDRRDIPVVFLTSHAERETVDKIRGVTRYGYIMKNAGNFVLQSGIEMAYELFASRKLSHDIFDAIPEPVCILDTSHNVIDANKAMRAALGDRLSVSPSPKCWQIMHCEQAHNPVTGCPMTRMKNTGNPESSIMKIEAMGALYKVTCTPLFDRHGICDRVLHQFTKMFDENDTKLALIPIDYPVSGPESR